MSGLVAMSFYILTGSQTKDVWSGITLMILNELFEERLFEGVQLRRSNRFPTLRVSACGRVLGGYNKWRKCTPRKDGYTLLANPSCGV